MRLCASARRPRASPRVRFARCRSTCPACLREVSRKAGSSKWRRFVLCLLLTRFHSRQRRVCFPQAQAQFGHVDLPGGARGCLALPVRLLVLPVNRVPWALVMNGSNPVVLLKFDAVNAAY